MRKFKDVGQWDHTNAMGAMFVFIIVTIIGIVLSAIWCLSLGPLVWLSIPVMWLLVGISVYFDMTEVVGSEKEGEQPGG